MAWGRGEGGAGEGDGSGGEGMRNFYITCYNGAILQQIISWLRPAN